jgi:hypothetical protein
MTAERDQHEYGCEVHQNRSDVSLEFGFALGENGWKAFHGDLTSKFGQNGQNNVKDLAIFDLSLSQLTCRLRLTSFPCSD